MGEKLGYARTSTRGQNLDIQVERLHLQGCGRIYKEQTSAATAVKRPELERLLDYVREGDIVYVTKLDRLARSVADLADISRTLDYKGVDLVVLDQAIDTTTSAGKLMFHMLAAISKFERELILERAQEGREKAKTRGVRFGARPKLSDKQLAELRLEFGQPDTPRAELAARYGISRASLYRLIGNDQKKDLP